VGRAPQLHFTLSCCNSLGLGLMRGNPVTSALTVLEKGLADAVIVLESDIYRFMDAETAGRLLSLAKNVVVIDSLATKTTAAAHFALPAATFAEADGTFVNNEGRAQRFYKVLAPQDEIREGWRWIRDLMLASGRPEAGRWQNFDGIVADLARNLPIFEAIDGMTPSASFRAAGQKIPRQPHRYSGRTAMHAHIDVSEPKPADDTDTPLSFSMEGYEGRPPSPLITRYWAPHWNSVQSVNKFQVEVNGPLVGGDPGRRLIEPEAAAQFAYVSEIPAAFQPQNGEVLVVPAYHVFGSEELSARATGIAGLSPGPYIAINPQEAEKTALKDGDIVEVTLSNVAYKLPVKLRASLPVGVAAVPAGLPSLQWDGAPVWRKVNPERTPQDVGSR
jgi:NADH-quinone oxidoreductase subunit G